MPYTQDKDEMAKSVTALALAGERLILLDNLAGLVGNPVLDTALTAVEWQGRILGKSQQPRLPLLASWFATGNNVTIAGDTARRTCHIRIETEEERPEDRGSRPPKPPGLGPGPPEAAPGGSPDDPGCLLPGGPALPGPEGLGLL